MKSGYYLSAYIHIDKLAHLEKVQVRHDQNIALWFLKNQSVELVHYWELERLTGIKKHNLSFYDCKHFEEVLNQLLFEYNISINDLVEIWGVPQYSAYNEPIGKVKGFSYHSTAHAYSVLLSNTNHFHNNNILVLAVDGGPDNVFDKEGDASFCACYANHGEIVEWISIASPAPLWSYAKNTFNLEEGSLMALMSACDCRWDDFPIALIEIRSLQSTYSAVRYLEHIRETIFSLQISDENKIQYRYDDRFTDKENRISMFMKIVSKVSDKIMCGNLNMIIQKLKINPLDTYLAIVGGYALNCPSNSYLLKKYHFKGFYDIPCVNDAGISLGYGLGEFYVRKPDIQFEFQNAFYGNKITFDEKTRCATSEYIESVSRADAETFAKDLREEVIIWLEDRCEIGPRALGHRSILADPTREQNKETLNKIKQRQWWRPVAPIILEEKITEWFEDSSVSNYMLKTFAVIPKEEERIKAVLHLDKSARVQTINSKQGFLYECVKAFYLLTDVPIVCNTSLNDKGEPIIDTFYGALMFAMKKDIRIIYINHFRVVLNKKKRELPFEDERYIDFGLYTCKLIKENVLRELNPYNVSSMALGIYYNNKKLYEKINLLDVKNVRLLERLERVQKIYQMQEN